MAYPRRTRRYAYLFRLYQASGSALPFATWLKHYQAGTSRPDAIVLPWSFWVVVTIAGMCAGLSVAVIGRAAGWW